MFTEKHRDETQRPPKAELRDLEADGLQELTADDASAVRGGGTLMSACATGVHIKVVSITP